MDLEKFNDLNELIYSINLGLDIKFYLYGTRYNISPGDDEYFICECPNGDAVYYKNGLDMVNNYKINDKLLKDIWKDIGLHSM